MSYVRRYTDDNTDSLALVSISSGATFKNIPNGKYVDAVTGDVKYVTDGTLTVPELAKANMRVYVCWRKRIYRYRRSDRRRFCLR